MQQQGGSPYGVPPPEMAPFSTPTAPGPGPRPHILGIPPSAADQQMAEAASPISSRPPPPPAAAAAAGAPRSAGAGFEEFVSGAGGGGFPDDEALAGAADEAERGGGGGGGGGNRWPKQETLALIKIRSEMDATFREATLKGPLWEEVSRKLGELGYRRSAKKCKEKFENVHKYYKRTKENRAGRQDGKSYRFFSQLEALGAASSSGSPAPTTTIGFAMAGPSAARIQPSPISAAAPPPIVAPARAATEIGHGSTIQGVSGSTTPTTPAAAAVGGISFSTNSSSSESDDTEEDEETEETGGQPHEHGSKRKRKGGSSGGGGGGSRKMMAFFEGLMKQVVERQEAMQQRFLETIEKREQDRMIREEAWRRQEMARLTREQELMAQERAMAASRDAAVLSFIQKISGQTIQLPTVPATPISAAPAPAPQPQRQTQQPSPPPQPVPPLAQPQPQREFRQKQQSTEIVLHQASTSSHELVPVPDPQESAPGAAGFETASSSRWPKAEVHALISLRSGLDIKYQEAGPKGPLWEEISAEMKKLGYNRSSKRCKEKWENINKYFKKVKESNKKRPEDSKTCPYFHQLDALYRQKQQGIGGGRSSSSGHRSGDQEAYSHSNPQEQGNVLSIMPPPPPPPSSQPPPTEAEIKTDGGQKNGGGSDGNGGSSGAVQIQTSNGGLTPTIFEEGPTKKPEGIVKELMERRDAADDCDEADDSYNMDGQDDDEDDEEEEEDDDEDGSKMRYEIQFQRPSNVSGGGSSNASTAATAAAATTTTTTTTAGSFLAMVQ